MARMNVRGLLSFLCEVALVVLVVFSTRMSCLAWCILGFAVFESTYHVGSMVFQPDYSTCM